MEDEDQRGKRANGGPCGAGGRARGKRERRTRAFLSLRARRPAPCYSRPSRASQPFRQTTTDDTDPQADLSQEAVAIWVLLLLLLLLLEGLPSSASLPSSARGPSRLTRATPALAGLAGPASQRAHLVCCAPAGPPGCLPGGLDPPRRGHNDWNRAQAFDARAAQGRNSVAQMRRRRGKRA